MKNSTTGSRFQEISISLWIKLTRPSHLQIGQPESITLTIRVWSHLAIGQPHNMLVFCITMVSVLRLIDCYSNAVEFQPSPSPPVSPLPPPIPYRETIYNVDYCSSSTSLSSLTPGGGLRVICLQAMTTTHKIAFPKYFFNARIDWFL